MFEACVSKVLVESTQNLTLHFNVSPFLHFLGWQVCLCTYSVWFSASSVATSMQHTVLSFMLAPIYGLHSVFLLLCLKLFPKLGPGKGRYIPEFVKW